MQPSSAACVSSPPSESGDRKRRVAALTTSFVSNQRRSGASAAESDAGARSRRADAALSRAAPPDPRGSGLGLRDSGRRFPRARVARRVAVVVLFVVQFQTPLCRERKSHTPLRRERNFRLVSRRLVRGDKEFNFVQVYIRLFTKVE